MHPPSFWQIILILAIVLLLFGGKKIPELAKGLGGGIKSFKKAMKEDEDEAKDPSNEDKPSIKNTQASAETSPDSKKQEA